MWKLPMFAEVNSVKKIANTFNRKWVVFVVGIMGLVLATQAVFFVANFILFPPNASYSGSEPTKTWDNDSGNGLWSDATNWSGNTLPTSSEVVIFDSTSTTNITIDTAVNVKGFYIDSTYTGTISTPSSLSMIVGSEGYTQNGGTVNLSSTGESIPTSGLVAQWKMDEPSGTTIADTSGSNNTASSNSAIVAGHTGSDYARRIDAGGYIGMTNAINMNGNWSISVWSKFPLPTTGDGWRTIVAQNGGNYHHIIIASDGQLGAYNAGFYSSGYDVDNLAAGWHNITVTATAGDSRYYVDGAQVGSSTNKVGQTMSIIGNPTTNSNQQAGTIDEFLVYNRVLSVPEVQGISSISNFVVNGNFTINSGTFTAPSNASVTGNWTNEGTFNHSNGTVNLTGNNQTIDGSTTFYNLSKTTTTPKTLTFIGSAIKTQTIAGTLTLQGAVGNNLSLRSSASPTQWRINASGDVNLAYLDVQDSNSVAAFPIDIEFSKYTDSGNNTNWADRYNCLTGGSHNGRSWSPYTACPGGIAGVHTNINNLSVSAGETVTVKPFDGVNYGTVEIQANTSTIAGSINGDYAGYQRNLTTTATNSGPGGSICGGDSRAGASHGGSGGYSLYQIPPALTYDSLKSPVQMGSGAGIDGCSNPTGSNGGAAIKLTVAGALNLTGTVTANGQNGLVGRSGGGAGGSVWLTVGTLSGNGNITTNGGSSANNDAAGGGGGRISVSFATNTFSGTITSNAGTVGNGGIYNGKNGTVYLLDSANNDLYIKNSQTWWANPSEGNSVHTYRDIFVQNNANILLKGYYTTESDGVGFTFNARNITVDSGSSFNSNGGGYSGGIAGHPQGYGPGGAPNTCFDERGGGSYGGVGGGSSAGTPYGNTFAPDQLGSGGRMTSCVSWNGGFGGGALKLNVSNLLTVNGTVASNGGDGSNSSGGSGGSLWIVTKDTTGNGTVSTNGGNGTSGNCSAGGGGGRLSYNYSGTNGFSGTLTSNGGSGECYGGYPGTLVIVDTTNNDLTVKTSQTWYANPAIDGSTKSFHKMIVQGNSTLTLKGYYTNDNDGVGFVFNLNEFQIDSGSTMNADLMGYAGGAGAHINGYGPGAGTTTCNQERGGGSYGGIGGGSNSGRPYSNAFAPDKLGSGGARNGCTENAGGAGGGAIKLNVATTTTVNGTITANGQGADRASSGSGGSIWIITVDTTGNGTVRANGGVGFNSGCNVGGGGGRVAWIYSGTNGFSGTMTATGGAGECGTGGNGTVLIKDSTNNDLYVITTQTWRADPANEGSSHTFRNVTVSGNSTWSFTGYYTNDSDGVGISINSTNFTLNSGSTISTNGAGYAGGNTSHNSGYGPGGGVSVNCNDDRGGGSYGGFGVGQYPGALYGNAFAPDKLGSGGRMDTCTVRPGSAGGGAVKLTVSNQLTLNGTISSDGTNSVQSSAGSGGSVWITSKDITGNGTITANGGNGTGGFNCPVGGGGGRIAYYYSGTNGFSGTLTANPGTDDAGCFGTAGTKGTVIIKDTTNNDIYIKSTQTWSADPAREGAIQTFKNVYVQNNSTLNLVGHYTSNVNGYGFTINATNVTIDSGSFIRADGTGYAGAKNTNTIITNTLADGAGPGGGQGNNCASTFAGGGGSYGGTGGNSSTVTYGSSTAPLDLGSGGGAGSNNTSCRPGGAGGGAIKFVVTDTLSVDGGISANGANVSNTGGAGSGGSIYVIAGTINSSVSAILQAKGGSSTCGTCSANGGGGRIAVYFTNENNWQGSAITPSNATTRGQSGSGGADGTVFIGLTSLPNITSLRQYRSDCSTVINVGGGTSQSSICLGGTISSSENPDNLTIEFEVQPLGSPFTNTPNFATTPIPFVGSPVNFTKIISGIDIGTSYHWQVRAQRENGIYSGWISYDSNSELEADFKGEYPTATFLTATASQSEGVTNPTLNVSLNDSISSTVLIDYAVTGGTAVSGQDFTLANGTLSFAADTTSKAIPLVIIDDQIQKTNKTIEITLSNPVNSTLGSITVFTYTIINNDTAGISVNQFTSGSNIVIEGGTTDSYSVYLNTKPTADVTVNLQANAQYSFSANSLTFSSLNWSIPQSVTVTAVNDEVAQGNRSVNINHSTTSSDTFYSGLNFAVTFQIFDNDFSGVTLLGGSSRTIYEDQFTAIGLVLTSQPTSNVVITPIRTNDEITLNASTITFTSENWFTAQYFNASGIDDSIVQGSRSSSVVFDTVSSDNIYNNYNIGQVSITINDNDNYGVTVTTGLSINEGSSQSDYIRLTSQPEADVTITISTNSQLTITPLSVTFTSLNWNVNQPISISAIHDFIENGNRVVNLTHTATSSDTHYNGITVQNIGITIVDIDASNVVIAETSGSTIISESGSTDSYSLVLTTQPSDPVTINISPSNPEVILSTTSVNFTVENWNTPQSITLSVAHDLISTGHRDRTISHVAVSDDQNYDGITISNLTVTVQDIDVAGYTITETSGGTYVTEGGSSDSFSVVLTSKPTFNVVINVTNNSQLIYSPNALVFTASNWNVPQTIGVSAVNDLIAQGNRTTNVELVVTSSDVFYGSQPNKYVNVSITDNDIAGVLITQSFGSTRVVKGSQTDSYTVVLTAQPEANVTITINAQSPLSGTPSTLTFTSVNWATPQTVTVSATNDDVVEATFTRQIQNTITSSDLHYSVLSPEIVVVQIFSLAPTEISSSKTLIEIDLNNEIVTDTYQLVLGSQPTADVVINIINNSDAVTILPTQITFTPLNWNIVQTVTLSFDPAYVSSATGLTTTISHQIVTADTAYSNVTIDDINIDLENTGGPVATPTPVLTATPTSTVQPTQVPTSAPTSAPTLPTGVIATPSTEITTTSTATPSTPTSTVIITITPIAKPTPNILETKNEDSRETVLALVVDNGGPLSPIILLFFTPFLFLLIASLLTVGVSLSQLSLHGGFSRGKVVEAITKEGINFVDIKVVNQQTGEASYRKTFFGGAFAANLSNGQHLMELSKVDYIPSTIIYDIKNSNGFVNGEFVLEKEVEKDLFYKIQFGVEQPSLWIILSILITLVSMINLAFTLNGWGVGIVLVSASTLVWSFLRNKSLSQKTN